MSHSGWTEVFASLSDTAFFEVVRHYLGPVNTPFHKPDIVSRMGEFLSRPEVVQRSVDFIDPDDALILSAIDLYEQSTSDTLERILSSISRLTLRERLYNLEERLLIWKNDELARKPFALTPLGNEIKLAGMIGPGVLLGPPIGTITTSSRCWYDDSFFNSALSFLVESHPIFRKEGGWRKKTLDLLKTRFPLLFGDGHGEDRLLLAGRGLLAAGLISRNGDDLEVNLEAWRELERRSPEQRRSMMAARAAVGRSLPADPALNATRTLTECLPPGQAYKPETLVSLLQISSGAFPPLSPAGAHRILAHLVLMGELVTNDVGGIGRPASEISEDHRLLHITPVGDISAYPGLPLFCDLALAAEVVKTDVVTEFRLVKKRFIDGLDVGLNSENLLEEVENYCDHPIPGNVRTLISEWESEFRSISLRLAVVLRVDGNRRNVIEETGVLKPYTLDKPADGIWILDYREQDSWRRALDAVGISQLPQIQDGERGFGQTDTSRTQSNPPYLPWNPMFENPPFAGRKWTYPDFRRFEPILDDIAGSEALKALGDDEREIFAERLARRIILHTEQIRPGAWRYEVMTAKGLDYRGKIRLAEAAISGRNEKLELMVAQGNDVKTVTLIPRTLEKDGDEHVIVGTTLPDEEEERYAIRKIGFLKRVKASLF